MKKDEKNKLGEEKTGKNEAMNKKRMGLTPMEVALSVVRANSDSGINTDPQGSWTGVPNDKYDRPIQDADDL